MRSAGKVWAACACLILSAVLAVLLGLVIYPSMVRERQEKFLRVNFIVNSQNVRSDNSKFCSPCWSILLDVSFTSAAMNRTCELYVSPNSDFNRRDQIATLSYAQRTYPAGTKMEGAFCLSDGAAYRCPCVFPDDVDSSTTMAPNTVAIVVGVALGIISISATIILIRSCCGAKN